jgi:hypothetical protein
MNNRLNNTEEYLNNEINFLRTNFADLRKETRALETYTLISVSAIWSWCAANSNSSHVIYLIWLPVLMVILFGIRAFGVYLQMITIKRYLVEIENNTISNDFGWEKFQRNSKLREIWPITAFAFWIILSVVTLIAPTLFR